METQLYTPENPEAFLRNLETRYKKYPDQISNMNEAPSKGKNAYEVYHVINATAVIRRLTKENMVKITTSTKEEKEKAKSLLEKIAGKFEVKELI